MIVIMTNETKQQVKENLEKGIESITLFYNGELKNIEINPEDKITIQDVVTLRKGNLETGKYWQFNLSDIVETYDRNGFSTRYPIQIGW